MRSPRCRDARRWRFVAPLVAGGIAAAGLAAADDGADDPRAKFGLGKPAVPTKPAPPPRDLFGLGGKARKPPPGCGEASQLPCPRRDGAAPAAIETVLSRAYLYRLPVADGGADTGAALTLGATRDDAGLAWSGASSLDNRWFVDGAAIESPHLGDLAARIPIEFIDHVRTRTAGWSARDRAGVGATIDVALREGGGQHRGTARAWLGAGLSPTPAPRLASQYRAFEARFADDRTVSAVGTVDGPLAALTGTDAWYVVGVAPRITDGGLAQRAFRRVDADADGVPDRDGDGAVVHEALAAQQIDALAYAVPLLARAGVRWGRHALVGTALGHVGRTTRWLGIAEDSAAGVDRARRDVDLIATYRGRWGATSLQLQGAWHREATRESPHDVAGGGAAVGFGFVPPPDVDVTEPADRAIRRGCVDAGDDPYPMIANCPFISGYYWTGGAGLLIDTIQDRPAVTAELEHRAGEHLIGFGVTGEDTRVELTQRYTGGFLRQVLFADATIDTRFVRLGVGPGFTDDCGDQRCDFVDRVATTYRTRHVAAYLTDTWRPDDTVAVEYGVRAQETQAGSYLTLREVLPRIGASWDFLGGGRSRGFAGWGRYAQTLPAAIGDHLYRQPTTLQTVDFAGTSRTLGGGGGLRVAPGTTGTRVDEALAGVEVGLADAIRLGASVRQRHLGRALEDDLGELATAGARGGTPATRDFTEVSVWLANSPAARLGMRVGYAWSRLRGNWPGPYDPVSGYSIYASSLFDGGPGTGQENATGALPNDQPHRFIAELALRGAWRGFAVEGGLRASAQSGRPIDARIGSAQVFAIPRGGAGRLPAVAVANLHLGARRGRFTASLDVFNLFDRRGVAAVDERYAFDTRPILGGDRSDLPWLKDDREDGRPARVNARYGLPLRYQSPLAALLGVSVEL